MIKSGRCGEIEVSERGNCVRLYWEMSGSPAFDLLLAPLDLTFWATGAKDPIPLAKQREILAALRQWLQSQRLRTDIDLPTDRRASEAICQWHGCEHPQLIG